MAIYSKLRLGTKWAAIALGGLILAAAAAWLLWRGELFGTERVAAAASIGEALPAPDGEFAAASPPCFGV